MTDASSATEMIARCLCGGLECRITPPTLGGGHCHCAYCRKAHGAPVVTWLLCPAEQVRIARGEDLLRWYRSSEQSRRGFCSTCGSMMLFQTTCAPGETHVARALIDGQVDHEPEFHSFSDHAVPWLQLGDDLPRLASDNELLAEFEKIPPKK